MKKLLFLMSAMLVLTLTSFGQLINKGTIKLENGEEKIASVPYQTLGVITLTSKQVEMKAISLGLIAKSGCKNKLSYRPIKVVVRQNTEDTFTMTLKFAAKNAYGAESGLTIYRQFKGNEIIQTLGPDEDQ